MRHDDHGQHLPTLEMLESRRLMSTSVFLGGQCLPPPKPTPGGTTDQPAPTPGHDDDQGDDDNDQGGDGSNGGGGNDQGGGDNPTPDPTDDTPAPVDVIIPQVIGNWSGSHQASDKSASGQLSLQVSQTGGDDLTALLDFSGAQHIRWSGQLLYNRKTGHLTMYYLSSSLVAKVDATLVTGGQAPTLVGTVEYFTREGSYKATFTLLHGKNPLPNP